jgi:hypothetical protein
MAFKPLSKCKSGAHEMAMRQNRAIKHSIKDNRIIFIFLSPFSNLDAELVLLLFELKALWNSLLWYQK